MAQDLGFGIKNEGLRFRGLGGADRELNRREIARGRV